MFQQLKKELGELSKSIPGLAVFDNFPLFFSDFACTGQEKALILAVLIKGSANFDHSLKKAVPKILRQLPNR
jgi:hypothetical protein